MVDWIILDSAVNNSNAKLFLFGISGWHPHLSVLSHVTTFSSFKFPFYCESSSNTWTTAVYRVKAASFQ